MVEDADRYALLHAIVAAAADLAGARLDAYLTSVCGDDAALRAEVLELLAAGADAERDDVFADRHIAQARESLDAIIERRRRARQARDAGDAALDSES